MSMPSPQERRDPALPFAEGVEVRVHVEDEELVVSGVRPAFRVSAIGSGGAGQGRSPEAGTGAGAMFSGGLGTLAPHAAATSATPASATASGAARVSISAGLGRP